MLDPRRAEFHFGSLLAGYGRPKADATVLAAGGEEVGRVLRTSRGLVRLVTEDSPYRHPPEAIGAALVAG